MFSFGRKADATFPTSDIQPYFPYADDWAKFDKLKKGATTGGPFRLVCSAADISVFSIGAFGLHHFSKRHGTMILMAWAALVTLDLFVATSARRRFAHWPCPRCQAEWPGTKTEKDRACNVCGLRLHQISP
jgi:hypothetical protein